MRAVIIGAGRGKRLGHLTSDRPKPLVPIVGKPMLDWVVEALGEGGFSPSETVYICGYRAADIKAHRPEFVYVENSNWANNNILASLMCAREWLSDGFVCSYADIVYRGSIVRDVLASPHDIVLGCDTDWRSRYVSRAEHPETDAEKLSADGDRVLEISRNIPSSAARGEYVGVAKFSPQGARALIAAFDQRSAELGDALYREGRTFPRAYLIDLLQDMIEQGTAVHKVDTHGGYMEIDTLEDVSNAETWWKRGAT